MFNARHAEFISASFLLSRFAIKTLKQVQGDDRSCFSLSSQNINGWLLFAANHFFFIVLNR
jgi:hypothetical protein